MASLQIDLFDKTNKRRIWVMLRDNLPIKDLIHKLIQDLELEQGEYGLVDEKSNVALPQESTLAKEGIKDQHALRIERKKKIVPIPIPIPIKKGEPAKPVDAKPPKAEPGAETPAEKSPPSGPTPAQDEPPPEEAQPAPEEAPEPAKKAWRTPARKLPPTRPILPPLQRPIRRPPFLRRIPNQSWGCATPLNILLILFILMLFCFLGRLTCNIQLPLAFFSKPDVAAVSSSESSEQTTPEEEEVVEQQPEIILPDLDEVYASLPDIEENYPGICYVVFNTEKEPFEDLLLRKAFAHSIDREYISRNWTCGECNFHNQRSATTTINPAEDFYAMAAVPDLYDKWVDHELSQGYAPEDISFQLLVSEQNLELAEFVAANWKEHLGIDVQLASQDFDSFNETISGADAPAAYVACSYLDKSSPADLLLLWVYGYYGDFITWDPTEDYLRAVLAGYKNNDIDAYLQAEKILVVDNAVIAPILSYHVD